LNEQKSKWIKRGDKREDVFRDVIAPQLGMSLTDGVKFGVDFYDQRKRPVELKYRDQPFYMAQKLLGMEPQYTVPINCSNLKRYTPNTLIIFWVDWKKGERFGIGVAKTRGLWSIKRSQIDDSDTEHRHHFYAARSTSESKCGERDAYGNNVCARYIDLRDCVRIDFPGMLWARAKASRYS
jgi:hypothetical protein